MLHLPSPSFALLRDAEGNPSGLVGFPVNITAQKPGDLAVRRNQEVERELQESEAGFVPPVTSGYRQVQPSKLPITPFFDSCLSHLSEMPTIQTSGTHAGK
jgi:hypothetical protein